KTQQTCTPQVGNLIDNPGNWSYPATAPNFDGNVTQIVFGPNQELLATTAGGSLWSSIDNKNWAQVYSSAGWQRRYNQNNTAAIVQIGVAPTGNLIYAGI